DRAGLNETLLTLSNGFVGVRGSFEQGSPHHQPGTLVNGFHETWEIRYPEPAFGYATTGQTIVFVPDATGLAVTDLEGPLDLAEAEVTRRLDLRQGTVTTTAVWPQVTVRWVRLVSLTRREVLALRVEIETAGLPMPSLVSGWKNRQDTKNASSADGDLDPRRAHTFGRRVLEAGPMIVEAPALSIAFRTARSHLDLAMALDHGPERSPAVAQPRPGDDFQFTLSGPTIEKRVAYVLSAEPSDATRVLRSTGDFDTLVEEQADELAAFWDDAAIEIGAEPGMQQAVNWVLFQLRQSSALLQGAGIPAKGLTGQAYEGHYFWDTDVFVLPFLAHHCPPAAAELIRFRHSMLPAARKRAAVLGHPGALYPWRTISGEEASAYFEAGTAQYHIDAAIIYGLDSYLAATGDDEILWDRGVEMAVETARFWRDLGFFEKESAAGGTFHIHMCTGPDEYSALVDDNAYTNHMARFNLERAATWTRRMEAEQPARYAALTKRIDLRPNEVDEWERGAQEMYLPIDPEHRITPQDARFLEREPWDWDTPPGKYPLLLHFHPLVIYRHQVLKQADVVMAMFLLPDNFSDELARANFAYYDPITTGDSSLSPPVQAAVAARVGRLDLALKYFRHAAFLDLADLAGNTKDGVHLATAGGVWQALVMGFAGFSWQGKIPKLAPHLPEEWDHLRFAVSIRGSRIKVDLSPGQVTVGLRRGEPIELEIWGATHRVTDQPVTVVR
ncbi:MAG: glycoside hydrolase family 65 protein, partial [Acidimicrobiia bacterium]